MEARKPRREPQRRQDGFARKIESRLPMNACAGEDVDRYLAEIIGELERIARAHNRELLAHLLAMAGVQATETNGGSERSAALH